MYNELSLYSRDESLLITVYSSFNVLLNLFCNALLRISASMFIRDIVTYFSFLVASVCPWCQGNAGLKVSLEVFPLILYFGRA